MSTDSADGAIMSRDNPGNMSMSIHTEPADCTDSKTSEADQILARVMITRDESDQSDESPVVRPIFANGTNIQEGNDDSKEPTQCCNFWGLPLLRIVPESDHNRAFDVLGAVVSLCLCLAEVGSEVKLLLEYYMTGQHLAFALTLGFIGVTAVVVGIFTLLWTLIDLRQHHGNPEESQPSLGTGDTETGRDLNSTPITTTRSKKALIACRICSSFLQFGRAFRLAEYIYNMYQGWKSKRKDEKRIRKAERELRDAAILGLLEGYLETALKFELQLYLMFTTDFVTRTRDIFLLVSLASIAISVTSCYIKNRTVNQRRESVTFQAYAVYLMMRLFELGPRLVLLVLCFKFVGWWTLLGILLHLVLMFVINTCHVRPENNQMCDQRCENFFYLFLSYVEIYSFINMNKEESKHTAVLYYVIFYLENAVMMSLVLGLTYIANVPCVTWCYFAYSAIPGFVLHVSLLYLYYSCVHPTRNRRETTDRPAYSQSLREQRV